MVSVTMPPYGDWRVYMGAFPVMLGGELPAPTAARCIELGDYMLSCRIADGRPQCRHMECFLGKFCDSSLIPQRVKLDLNFALSPRNAGFSALFLFSRGLFLPAHSTVHVGSGVGDRR